ARSRLDLKAFTAAAPWAGWRRTSEDWLCFWPRLFCHLPCAPNRGRTVRRIERGNPCELYRHRLGTAPGFQALRVFPVLLLVSGRGRNAGGGVGVAVSDALCSPCFVRGGGADRPQPGARLGPGPAPLQQRP